MYVCMVCVCVYVRVCVCVFGENKDAFHVCKTAEEEICENHKTLRRQCFSPRMRFRRRFISFFKEKHKTFLGKK